MSNTLQTALAMAKRGWQVFPVKGKHPLKDTRGFHDATTDERQVREWWGGQNGLGIGIATGEVSGLWVLDVDGPEGEDELGALELEHGELPETIAAKTRNGRHFYFRMNSRTVRNSTSKVAPRVDVRGTGGYVVAPPSPHPDGGTYRWEEWGHPKVVDLADPPPLAPGEGH